MKSLFNRQHWSWKQREQKSRTEMADDRNSRRANTMRVSQHRMLDCKKVLKVSFYNWWWLCQYNIWFSKSLGTVGLVVKGFSISAKYNMSVLHVCLFIAIALSLQDAEKKSKSQPSSGSLYPSVSNIGSVSTSAVKNREPRKVTFHFTAVARCVRRLMARRWRWWWQWLTSETTATEATVTTIIMMMIISLLMVIVMMVTFRMITATDN